MVSLFPSPCPQLPQFQSLLVKGPYHPSAPIHLLLSHTRDDPEARAILLSPRREDLKAALVEFNDQWIKMHGGHGNTCAVSQRVQIFYPPTLAHLRLMLSMLHEYDGAVHSTKTTLDTAPTLLVLHEISTYFSSHASEATVSAYLSVVSSALALASSWSPSSTTTSRVAIFDSGLTALKLPILKSLSFDEPEEEKPPQRDALSVLLERYIHLRVEFSEPEENDPEDDTQTRRFLKMHRIEEEATSDSSQVHSDSGAVDDLWTWTEFYQVNQDGDEETVFCWDP